MIKSKAYATQEKARKVAAQYLIDRANRKKERR